MPYFKDLFKDLCLRSFVSKTSQEKRLDRISFIDYCKLPGIINERFYKIFDPKDEGSISEASF